MKIGTNKKMSLAMNLLIMVVFVPILIMHENPMWQTQIELEKLYSTWFINDTIVSVIERQYPGGKGLYTLFSAGPEDEYYPVLLDSRSPHESYLLFTPGCVVSKEQNSYNLTLSCDGKVSNLIIRNPKDQDHRLTILTLAMTFFGIGFLFQLFLIPNKMYDQHEGENYDDE